MTGFRSRLEISCLGLNDISRTFPCNTDLCPYMRMLLVRASRDRLELVDEGSQLGSLFLKVLCARARVCVRDVVVGGERSRATFLSPQTLYPHRGGIQPKTTIASPLQRIARPW